MDWYWPILIAASAGLSLGIGWVMFDSWDDFWEAVKFWLTPDIVSIFRGEWVEDRWAELKLFYFLALCAMAVFGVHVLLGKVGLSP